MIQRVVFVRLKSEHRSDADRQQIAQHTREVLATCPLVRDLRVAPAMARTLETWDLVFLVQLDGYDAIEAYRVDRTHRAFADIYLKPMAETVHVFHFELP